MNVRHRLATPADRHCAEADFLASYRDSMDAGLISRSRWWDCMRAEVERILDLPGVALLVAYNPDMPPETEADIYGWLAVQGVAGRRALDRPGCRERDRARGVPVVLYVYVKAHYRGFGIARGLFREAGIDPWGGAFDYVARTEMMFRHERRDDPRPLLIQRISRRARWYPPAARKEARNVPEEAPAASPRPGLRRLEEPAR